MQGSLESKQLSLSGNRKALQLTLQPSTPSQSGVYTCVADNGFQRVEKMVSLSVFPPGTWHDHHCMHAADMVLSID